MGRGEVKPKRGGDDKATALGVGDIGDGDLCSSKMAQRLYR